MQFDPQEVHIVKLKCKGGRKLGPASVAPKVGPFGLSPRQVSDRIEAATRDWLDVPVIAIIFIQNRNFRIEVEPTVSSFLIKLRPEVNRKGSSHNSEWICYSDISMEEVIDIARIMQGKSTGLTLKAVVKEVVGTSRAVGYTIHGRHAKAISKDIDDGIIEIPEY